MKRQPLTILFVLAVMALNGCCSAPKQAEHKDVGQSHVRRNPNLIAHIEHDGLSFSVSLDNSDTSFLKIHISKKFSSFAHIPPTPTVELRVQMTDETSMEGAAPKPLGGAGNGGSAEFEYRFVLGRRISVDDIHSVTISIDAQRYELFPF
jgi:hypothetical protein